MRGPYNGTFFCFREGSVIATFDVLMEYAATDKVLTETEMRQLIENSNSDGDVDFAGKLLTWNIPCKIAANTKIFKYLYSILLPYLHILSLLTNHWQPC